MQFVKIKGSRFFLKKEGGPEGDSGPMLLSIDNEGKPVGENGEVHLGCSIKCGAIFARTFGNDWWMTSTVTEFLDKAEDDSWVRIKTRNSIYKVGSI